LELGDTLKRERRGTYGKWLVLAAVIIDLDSS